MIYFEAKHVKKIHPDSKSIKIMLELTEVCCHKLEKDKEKRKTK